MSPQFTPYEIQEILVMSNAADMAAVTTALPNNRGTEFMLEEAVDKLAREDEEFKDWWGEESSKFDSDEARWLYWHMLNGDSGEIDFLNGDDTVAMEFWPSEDWPELKGFAEWVGLHHHTDGSVFFAYVSQSELEEIEREFEDVEDEFDGFWRLTGETDE